MCIDVMCRDYHLTKEEAQLLFRQAWVHTFGICVLIAGKVCQISQEEVSEMLSLEVNGMLALIKSGTLQTTPVNRVEK